MKKKGILLIAVILLSTAGLVQAQEGELHGVVDVTFQGKYVWRGFDVYGDKSAIQPSVNLDLYGTGFGISAMGHRANSSGYENSERWDYTLYYYNSIFEGETYATNYMVGWVYYNYPNISDELADLEEIYAVLSWPEICPAGIVPSYVICKLWPANSGSVVGSGAAGTGTASGFAHIVMLDYGWTIQGLTPDIPEQTLNLHTEVVFNDGVGPAGQNVDHDWSNAVFGISTGFELADNLTFTPGLYYQVTMDDSVNDDKDETWLTFSMTYKF